MNIKSLWKKMRDLMITNVQNSERVDERLAGVAEGDKIMDKCICIISERRECPNEVLKGDTCYDCRIPWRAECIMIVNQEKKG